MLGPCRAIALSLGTLLACGATGAFAADGVAKRPLQLKFASPASSILSAGPAPAMLSTRGATRGTPRGTRFRVKDPSLGERALSSLLDDADQAAQAPTTTDGATFRFNRTGNAGRAIAQGYKNVCDTVSRKVWDDPNGKRVKFDVAGKPGVGIEIPLR